MSKRTFEAIEREAAPARAPYAGYVSILDTSGELNNVLPIDLPERVLVLGEGLSLEPSTIPEAGLGVFLTYPQGARRGDVITEYVGAFVDPGRLLLAKRAGLYTDRHHSHALLMPDTSLILANFVNIPVSLASKMKQRGIILRTETTLEDADLGLQLIKEPQIELVGRSIGGYLNSVTDLINCVFVTIRDPRHAQESVAALTKRGVSAYRTYIVALRDIKAGEELFLNYNRVSGKV